MAERKRIVLRNAPSLSELRAAFERPDEGTGLKNFAEGLVQSIDLADKLATRDVERRAREGQIKSQDLKTSEFERQLAEAAERRKRLQEFQFNDPRLAELSQVDPEQAFTLQQEKVQGGIKGDLTEEQKVRDFGRTKELEGIKFENAKKLKEMEMQFKKAKSADKLSGGLQRQFEKSKSVDKMVNEMQRFVDTLDEEGFTNIFGAGKIKLDEVTRGFAQEIPLIGQLLKVNPEITSFEQARDALGRRLYKDISGDVGNIAQQEGKFAKLLIPTGKEAVGLRQQKIDRIQRFHADMREGMMQLDAAIKSGKITPEEGEQMYKELVTDAMNEATVGLTEEGSIRGASADSDLNAFIEE